MPNGIEIRLDDPASEPVASLLREHLLDVIKHSPACSVHAFSIESLCAPGVTFWSAVEEQHLLGCGALLELNAGEGEIKSMRTARDHLRKGVGSRLVEYIVQEARRRGYTRLSLETGSQLAFAPARALYARHGFEVCGPFGNYALDENSVFMTLRFVCDGP